MAAASFSIRKPSMPEPSWFLRFVISDITPNSCHFEQAFSNDGGKTWELNWIATDTRVQIESDKAH